MDKHTLDILEYEKVRDMLAGYSASGLSRGIISRLRPLRSLEKVRLLVDQTTEMTHVIKLGRVPLPRLNDPRIAIRKLRTQPILSEASLRDIYLAICTTCEVKELFASLGPDYPCLTEMGERLTDFPELRTELVNTIDEESQVRDSASSKLRELRTQIASLRSSLKIRAYDMANSSQLRPFLQSQTVSVRNGRYVLPVKVESKNMVNGVVHDRSQTGSTVFVEPEQLVLIGNKLEIAYADEQREIHRILLELTMKVREHADSLISSFDTLAWVDFTYAKARFSVDYDMTPPILNAEGIVNIKEALHPLLVRMQKDAERAASPEMRLRFATSPEARKQTTEHAPLKPSTKVVPVDIRIGDDFQILVITGPNTGGKTVTLKTMGLLTLMAMSGMHVLAAKGSRFSVFEHVFADIGDEQSIEQSLSTFSSHMTNIARIVCRANKKSLVLLDELGAGTDPAEGAALAMAILDRLFHLGARAAVTTHIGSLKTYAYRRSSAQNASVEFDPDTLRPTYRLLIGQPGSSNAVTIAKKLGVPKAVVSAANRILTKTKKSKSDELMTELQRSHSQMEEQRTKTESAAKEAHKLQQEAEERVNQIKHQQQALEREAEQSLDDALRRVQGRIDDAVKELQNAPKPFAEKAHGLQKAIREEIDNAPIGKRRAAFAQSLMQGQHVYVPRFGKHCRIERVNKGKRRLTISTGRTLMDISFDDVSWLRPQDTSDLKSHDHRHGRHNRRHEGHNSGTGDNTHIA